MNSGTSPPTAVITGAAHGIGLAIAHRLASDGFRILAIDCDAEGLAGAPLPPGATRVIHDLGGALEPVRDTLETSDLRVLVNNVGVMDGRSFLELPVDTAEESLQTNIIGTWKLTRLVVDQMISHGNRGAIVFNLSLHSTRVRMCPDYSVSKAALSMLVQELSSELGPYQIRVNAVSPGSIDTWSDQIANAEEHLRASSALVPLGRVGSPEDVAEAVSFLCDEERAAYITGADLRVDGGLNQFNWLHHLYGSAAAERARVQPKADGPAAG